MRNLIFTYCLLLFLFIAFCIYVYLAKVPQSEKAFYSMADLNKPTPGYSPTSRDGQNAVYSPLNNSEPTFEYSPFNRGEQVAMYASCNLGETYVIQKDLLVLEYDYLQIPLVKPGIQAFDVTDDDLKDVRPEMKLNKIGKISKGDQVEIISFVEEGGWIPCKGDWYMANPLVKVKTGKMAGKIFGVSFLCDYQREYPKPFKTGQIGFMKINTKYLMLK